MRVPTLGGLKAGLSGLKAKGINTEKVEKQLAGHGERFDWSDNTLIKRARQDLNSEAADQYSSGATAGIAGTFTALVGAGLTALTIGAGAVAMPVIGVALAAGGALLLAKGVKDVAQGNALAGASQDLQMFAEMQKQLPAKPQPSDDRRVREQNRAVSVVRAVKAAAHRSLERMDRDRDPDPSHLVLRKEKRTEGLLSGLCTATFEADARIENHELVEFRSHTEDKGHYRTHSFQKTERGTLYTYKTNGATHQALENPNGTITPLDG